MPSRKPLQVVLIRLLAGHIVIVVSLVVLIVGIPRHVRGLIEVPNVCRIVEIGLFDTGNIVVMYVEPIVGLVNIINMSLLRDISHVVERLPPTADIGITGGVATPIIEGSADGTKNIESSRSFFWTRWFF